MTLLIPAQKTVFVSLRKKPDKPCEVTYNPDTTLRFAICWEHAFLPIYSIELKDFVTALIFGIS